ncbi:MAG: aminoglycoside phosphotransferase family protein [Thermomicrobiales bacterium]
MATSIGCSPSSEHGNAEPDRPVLDNPAVQRLAADIAPGTTATDLGGAFSLNALLEPAGLVLRVHQPDVTRRRLEAQQEVRRRLAGLGVCTPVPLVWQGSTVLRCGGRWAELERYIPHEMMPVAIESYPWLFRAMGDLHRTLDEIDVAVPRPAFSTYGPPGTLLRWLPLTEAAVRGNPAAMAVAHRLRQLLRQLSRQWVPARDLPVRIVHGDGKLRNVVRGVDGRTVYLDFGFMAVRPRIHELGYALARMLLSLGVGETTKSPEAFAWEQVPPMIREYEVASGVVLTAQEWRALAPYAAGSCLFQAAMCWMLPDAIEAFCDDERRQLMTIAAWLLDHPESVSE